MPRPLRYAPGGLAYHVINRGTGKMRLFAKNGDYRAFEKVLVEAHDRVAMRLCAYVIMPNHWHLVLWPRHDGDLSLFVGWLTMTHSQRWHAHRGTTGTGHIYQGRFKSFPIQTDHHFLNVCRYVERNPLRADLVDRAEDWSWGSFATRRKAAEGVVPVSDWPVPRPRNWNRDVNDAQPSEVIDALRICVQRGRPYGGQRWTQSIATRLGLQPATRPRGRPRIMRQPGKGS